MVDYVGYLASILIAISITLKGGIYFRILNMVGSICFFIYGMFIGSWPVAIINVYAVGINTFHLVKLIKSNKK